MVFLLRPDELPFHKSDIVTHAAGDEIRTGSRLFLHTLSQRQGVAPENIFLTVGASMANFVVWSILIERGDEVLVEYPVYEPMFKVPQYLGATVKYFMRDAADFSITVESIAAKLSDNTRMIILSDSHNPSGNQISGEVLQYLKELNQERGIHVFIDEIYSHFYRQKSLFVDYPEFIVTSSLSKYFGLGSLRVGWAFAPAEIVERARQFVDFLMPEMPITTFHLAHVLLNSPQLPELEARIRQRIKSNRELLVDFLGNTNYLITYIPRNGVLFFPQVKQNTDIRKFYSILYEKYKMIVTEGFYFQSPDNFRIAGVLDRPAMQSGLERLESALREASG